MKHVQHISLSLACIMLSGAALAETIKPKVLPGLWEVTQSIMINGKSMDADLQKLMENVLRQVPPEERAKMQREMGYSPDGKRLDCLSAMQITQGIDLDQMRREMSKDQSKDQKDCQFKLMDVSDKGGKFESTCRQPDGTNVVGRGEYIVKSDKEWVMNFEGDGVISAPGGAKAGVSKLHTKMSLNSRWKSSQCGDVKSKE